MSEKKLVLSWNKNRPETPKDVLVRHEGIEFPFTLRNFSSDVPTFKQIFIDYEYQFSVKSPPKVIVDAGANIGLASLYFSSKYPDATIIAIEPEDSNFELLKKNVSPYHNIIPLQAALWDENGSISLVDTGLGHWGFMTENDCVEDRSFGDHCHDVVAVTIDRIMSDYSIEKIDILKIDVEGAEKEIFNNSSAWIDRVNTIIIELHESMKPGCNRSFYNGSNGFDGEWEKGENIFLTRNQYVSL